MKKYYIFLLLSICFFKIVAQDIHFSQYYQTPLLINPALSGMYDGNKRALINYKDQWRSVAAPYKTMAFSYDMPILTDKWDNSHLGIGLNAFNDRVGKFNWGLTQINLSLSSIISMNARNRISAGIQGGIAQRNFSGTQLKWDSQFDGQNYDANLSSGETENFNSRLYGDVSAGVSWIFNKPATNISSNDHFKAISGISIYHINTPEQQYYSQDSPLYARLVAHGGAYIGIKNTNITFIPTVLFLQQGTMQEINVGGMIRYKLRQESKYSGNIKGAALLIGGHYRITDAIIPTFMIEMANFAFGISYDINTSGLTSASNGQGGIEISLRYMAPSPFQSSSCGVLF